MNGYFSEVKKRDRSNEAHKKFIQNKTRKNRELYIGYENKTTLDLPELNDEQLEKFKKRLQKENNRDTVKLIAIPLLIAMIIFLLINYFLK